MEVAPKRTTHTIALEGVGDCTARVVLGFQVNTGGYDSWPFEYA